LALSPGGCQREGHGTRDDVDSSFARHLHFCLQPVQEMKEIQRPHRRSRSDRDGDCLSVRSKGEVQHVSVSIKPLEDRILVRTLEAEQTTASGLVIPDTAKEKPQEGEVLAVGPGRVDDSGNRVPLDISVGDKVIYSKYGGTEVKYSGEEYLILSARDVLAVIEK
jgi:chaperonin GroES